MSVKIVLGSGHSMILKMRGFSAFPGGNGNPHWLGREFLLRLATHYWWSSPSQMTWLPSGQFVKAARVVSCGEEPRPITFLNQITGVFQDTCRC